MWTRRARGTATAAGKVTRSRSSNAGLKTHYDALVIGGGKVLCEY